MKKLNKLYINPEKVLKNEELIRLSGGTIGNFYHCYCDPGKVIIPWSDEWYGCYTGDNSASSHISSHCHDGMGSCYQTGTCELNY